MRGNFSRFAAPISIALALGIAPNLAAQNKPPPLATRVPATSAKIIKHLRSDKGIPLPGAEVLNTPLEKLHALPVIDDKALQNKARIIAGIRRRNSTVPPIPDCKVARTNSQPVPQGAKIRVQPDTLYIRAQNLPLDPGEVFGEKTAIRKFSGKPNYESYSIALLKIPCLPYRVRIVSDTIFRDEGDNALKNYEIDPLGEGELKDQMKHQLNRQEKR